MREHCAVFVKARTVEHVYKLRDLILTNSNEFKSVSQYLSRIGLFTTADSPKGDVPWSAVAFKSNISLSDVQVQRESDCQNISIVDFL